MQELRQVVTMNPTGQL